AHHDVFGCGRADVQGRHQVVRRSPGPSAGRPQRSQPVADAQTRLFLRRGEEGAGGVATPGEGVATVDLFPWSAKFALVCAVVTVGVMWVVSSTVDGPIRWTEVDPEAAYHCRSAVLLLFSAVITELCFLASSGVTLNIVDDFEKKNQLRLHGAGDSMLTLAEYGFKFVCGMYIYLEDGGIMHADQLAWGGPRPVYLGRFIQWGTTVPILILISNRAFLAEIGMTMLGFAYGHLLFYCCWLCCCCCLLFLLLLLVHV
ncbi:unnamed protein product, partial [Polarella glacialis]